RPGEAPEAAYDAACARIDALVERLRAPGAPLPPLEPPGGRSAARSSNFPEARYCAAVERAKEYILAGDAFQVVLSQRFEADRAGVEPLSIYRALRVVNPSPYMFHLVYPEACVTGASPEVMVRLEGGAVELRPI